MAKGNVVSYGFDKGGGYIYTYIFNTLKCCGSLCPEISSLLANNAPKVTGFQPEHTHTPPGSGSGASHSPGSFPFSGFFLKLLFRDFFCRGVLTLFHYCIRIDGLNYSNISKAFSFPFFSSSSIFKIKKKKKKDAFLLQKGQDISERAAEGTLVCPVAFIALLLSL